MQKIQDLATSLIKLWNLMDTPIEEQQMFQSVTCNRTQFAFSGFHESWAVDAGSILEQFEISIGKVKEEAFSRKEILEQVEKWMGACSEECWLEEYNRVFEVILSVASN